jgi:hypothetical protein
MYLKAEVLLPKTPSACGQGEALQLAEIQAPNKAIRQAASVPFKGADQPLEQLTTLLLAELEDMLNCIDHRIDATQPIQISLPVWPYTPGHQLLIGAGESKR